MRELGPASHDDMVLAFLRAEINSSIFGSGLLQAMAELGHDRGIIDDPNVSSDVENASRRAILTRYRGPHDDGTFLKLPDDVRWRRVSMSVLELERVRSIEAEDVRELQRGTRRLSDRLPSDGWEPRADPRLGTIIEAIEKGADLEPLIIVAGPGDSGMVVMEGHNRLTAYLAARPAHRLEVRVILGTSPRIAEWPLYGDPDDGSPHDEVP